MSDFAELVALVKRQPVLGASRPAAGRVFSNEVGMRHLHERLRSHLQRTRQVDRCTTFRLDDATSPWYPRSALECRRRTYRRMGLSSAESSRGTRRAEYGLPTTPGRLKSQRREAVRTVLATSFVPDAAGPVGLFNMDFGENRRPFGPKCEQALRARD